MDTSGVIRALARFYDLDPKALDIEADKKIAGLIAPIIIRCIANDLQKCLIEWTK